jgi:regulatory protein
LPWSRRPAREPVSSKPPIGGRISAIRQQEHDPNRVNVFLDGEFGFGLSAKLLLSEALSIGDDLSAERVVALRAMDEVGHATDAALRLLAQRPRSAYEIRDRLQRRGFASEAIDAVVGKLEEWRYLDDAEFARLWVDNRERHRPRGRRLLEVELRQKGVDREIVQETLDAASIDEVAAAFELGRAKLRGYAGLDPRVARRRLAGFLARRGFDGATVRTVTDRLLGESAPDEGGASAPDE